MASYVNPITETPTAKIRFKGLMLMCFNRINGKRQFEVGFVPCPGHYPMIEIKVIRLFAPPLVVQHRICSDLYFFARGATVDEIIPLESPVWGFHPHHADLEGRRLHERKVGVDTSLLTTRLRVNAGRLFTHEHVYHGNECRVKKWIDPIHSGEDHAHFGKLAKSSGINIQCPVHPLSGIAIFDRGSGLKSWLPSSPGTRYEITIDSDCRQHPPEGTTDFRLYYTSRVIYVDGYKYDFSLSSRDALTIPLSPDVCVAGFLGATDTLGLRALSFEELDRDAKTISREREFKKSLR